MLLRRLCRLVPVVLAVAMPWSGLAAAQKWESLFDGRQFGRWKVVEVFDFAKHGKVEVKDGRFVLGKGRPGTAIRYTGKLPQIDYEISLDAMRVAGDDFFCGMTFPVGKTPCTLIVGGWGGPVCGLSLIDDEPAAENETCVYKEFKTGKWYKIRLRVTAAKIEAWIDQDKIVDFETEGHKLTIWFEDESVLPLSIATWRTTAALRNLRMRRIKTE